MLSQLSRGDSSPFWKLLLMPGSAGSAPWCKYMGTRTKTGKFKQVKHMHILQVEKPVVFEG